MGKHFLARFVREPLVHFLIFGAALFAAYSLLHHTGDAEVHEILVSRGELAHLAQGFARLNQRPPTPADLQGLIGEYVRGEIFNREALALGLERDDPVIRNRLRQKMQFLSEDVAAITAPSDEQLREYLAMHADMFRVEQRFTFAHVYFNPDSRHEHLAHDAQQALNNLRADDGAHADLATQGDPFLLEHRFKSLTTTEVSKLFGDAFTKRLAELPIGTWAGPIESGYGQHLVLLEERTAGRVPTLEQARAAVSGEWMNGERLRANAAYYQGLLKRYKVVIDEPSAADYKPSTATGQ
jgi:hypothetical protein